MINFSSVTFIFHFTIDVAFTSFITFYKKIYFNTAGMLDDHSHGEFFSFYRSCFSMFGENASITNREKNLLVVDMRVKHLPLDWKFYNIVDMQIEIHGVAKYAVV